MPSAFGRELLKDYGPSTVPPGPSWLSRAVAAAAIVDNVQNRSFGFSLLIFPVRRDSSAAAVNAVMRLRTQRPHVARAVEAWSTPARSAFDHNCMCGHWRNKQFLTFFNLSLRFLIIDSWTYRCNFLLWLYKLKRRHRTEKKIIIILKLTTI